MVNAATTAAAAAAAAMATLVRREADRRNRGRRGRVSTLPGSELCPQHVTDTAHRVNGVRADGIYRNVSQFYGDWDSIYFVKTTIVDDGWIAEYAIPGVGLAVERVGSSAHDAATPQFVSSPGYEHAWLNPDNTEVSHQDLLSAPAVKLLVRKLGMSSAELAAALGRHVGLLGDVTYSTNDGLVEISPVGISKALGIEEVARPLEVCAEDVVAFGDMPNDVPMLRWAGHGVAMANAHPDAIAAANEVTTDNDDDGLARVLERWWL